MEYDITWNQYSDSNNEYVFNIYGTRPGQGQISFTGNNFTLQFRPINDYIPTWSMYVIASLGNTNTRSAA